ncbi:murein hydrolase activator EnvC family protein [Candidatus Margulisiibacteriota bacterium]
MYRIVLLLLVILIAVPSFLGGSQKARLNSLYNRIERERMKLFKVKRESENVMRNIYSINKKLRTTSHRLYYTQGQIRRLSFQQQQNRQNIQKIESSYRKRKYMLRSRIVEIYKDNNLGYLNVFFSPQSFQDFINKSYFFEKLLENDAQNIQTLINQESRLAMENQVLNRKTYQVEKLRDRYYKEKQNYQTQKNSKQTILNDLERRTQEYEKNIAVLEQNSREIEALLVNMIKSGKLSGNPGTGRYMWPCKGRLTSGFGWRRHPYFRVVKFHQGLDIAAPYGTPIKAADSGLVIFADRWGGYGRAVILDHGGGKSTVYAHMSKIITKKGDIVSKGTVIGKVGSSGYSTGPHVHFEIRKNGKPTNPRPSLP